VKKVIILILALTLVLLPATALAESPGGSWLRQLLLDSSSYYGYISCLASLISKEKKESRR